MYTYIDFILFDFKYHYIQQKVYKIIQFVNQIKIGANFIFDFYRKEFLTEKKKSEAYSMLMMVITTEI